MTIQISCPYEITEGMEVTLTASAPSSPGRYKYTFILPDGKKLETISDEDVGIVKWNTTDMAPGNYTIKAEVEAELKEADKAAKTKEFKKDSGSCDVIIRQRPLSIDDVQNLVSQASGFANKLADNMAQLSFSQARAAGQNEVKNVNVSMQRSRFLTDDLRNLAAFFSAVRDRTDKIGFNRYNEFINRVLCSNSNENVSAACPAEDCDEKTNLSKFGMPSITERRDELSLRPSIYGADAYNLLKTATEAFLIFETGIVVKPAKDATSGQYPGGYEQMQVPGEVHRLGDESVTFKEITDRLGQYMPDGKLPYLNRIVGALIGVDTENDKRKEKLPYCDSILRNRFSCPSFIELIWSYWHEEAMLVQTMNAITLRFQNRRGNADRDPLAHLEIDQLRPLNNLLWGYIQDELHRLTLPRRAYEYDHHYGLTIYGKAVPNIRSADSRSKFLEAFHNLLYRTSIFYHEDADTTVIADAFPLLNALREVHLLLAEGAHNQFGDLPWTARGEMLIQQWLLSRPEVQQFLRGRAMVPYAEPWMGQVDTMKRLQGWSETTITNFHELAIFGEQILLSIRYHDWSVINNQDEARLWAQSFKPEIQRYIHSYRAVSGVDLSNEPVDASPPWVHLRKRLAEEQRRRAGR